MKWCADGKNWSDFRPDNENRVVSVTLTAGGDFLDYLTEKDWSNLKDLLKIDYPDSLASITLSRTHRYMDEGDLRHAIIEGTMALELAIEEFYQLKLKNNPKLKEELNAFWNLADSVKLVALGTALKIEEKDIENTIHVIEIRHKIVHEGKDPDHTSMTHLISLRKVISKLLDGIPFRFPTTNHGNALMSPEEWKKGIKNKIIFISLPCRK